MFASTLSRHTPLYHMHKCVWKTYRTNNIYKTYKCCRLLEFNNRSPPAPGSLNWASEHPARRTQASQQASATMANRHPVLRLCVCVSGHGVISAKFRIGDAASWTRLRWSLSVLHRDGREAWTPFTQKHDWTQRVQGTMDTVSLFPAGLLVCTEIKDDVW